MIIFILKVPFIGLSHCKTTYKLPTIYYALEQMYMHQHWLSWWLGTVHANELYPKPYDDPINWHIEVSQDTEDFIQHKIDKLVQYCIISTANTLEMLQSGIKPSKWLICSYKMTNLSTRCQVVQPYCDWSIVSVTHAVYIRQLNRGTSYGNCGIKNNIVGLSLSTMGHHWFNNWQGWPDYVPLVF